MWVGVRWLRAIELIARVECLLLRPAAACDGPPPSQRAPRGVRLKPVACLPDAPGGPPTVAAPAERAAATGQRRPGRRTRTRSSRPATARSFLPGCRVLFEPRGSLPGSVCKTFPSARRWHLCGTDRRGHARSSAPSKVGRCDGAAFPASPFARRGTAPELRRVAMPATIGGAAVRTRCLWR